MMSLAQKNILQSLIATILVISTTQQAFFTLDTNYKKVAAAAITLGAVSYGCYNYALHNAIARLEQNKKNLLEQIQAS